MKRFLLVLLLAVAGLAVAKDTVEDMVRIDSGNLSPATASSAGGTAAPSVRVITVDPDFLETYATELPYPYLLNPREALALGVNWMEGDPYYSADLFGPGTVTVQIEVGPAAQGTPAGGNPAGSLEPDVYATELPYPYLLNPREMAELGENWSEGDPYLQEDLFRPVPATDPAQ